MYGLCDGCHNAFLLDYDFRNDPAEYGYYRVDYAPVVNGVIYGVGHNNSPFNIPIVTVKNHIHMEPDVWYIKNRKNMVREFLPDGNYCFKCLYAYMEPLWEPTDSRMFNGGTIGEYIIPSFYQNIEKQILVEKRIKNLVCTSKNPKTIAHFAKVKPYILTLFKTTRHLRCESKTIYSEPGDNNMKLHHYISLICDRYRNKMSSAMEIYTIMMEIYECITIVNNDDNDEYGASE